MWGVKIWSLFQARIVSNRWSSVIKNKMLGFSREAGYLLGKETESETASRPQYFRNWRRVT
jgi:hypothetical protein